MKKQIIFTLLFLIICFFSVTAGIKHSDFKIFNQRVNCHGDSVYISFDALPQHISSDYELILTPVVYRGSSEYHFSDLRFVGNRRLKLLKREQIFSKNAKHQNKEHLSCKFLNLKDTLHFSTRIINQPNLNHLRIHVDALMKGCCSVVQLLPKELGVDYQVPQVPSDTLKEKKVEAPKIDKKLSPTEELAFKEKFIFPESRFKPDMEHKVRDSYSLHFFFKKGYRYPDPSNKENDKAIKRLSDALQIINNDKMVKLSHMMILGRTSIDGNPRMNQKLSKHRYECIRDLIISKNKIKVPFGLLDLGEDWVSLAKKIEVTPHVPYKSEVLSIIRNIPINKGRKSKLIHLHKGIPYNWIKKHIFPSQRTVSVRLYYEKRSGK